MKDIKNIDQYLPEFTGDSLIIVHDLYDVETKYQTIKWSKFKNEYIDHKEENIVVVGLNRIRTPESRYDLVYSYLYKMNDYKNKVTIDNSPFTGEPWRCWYHYGFLFREWLGVDYSNVLESDWSHWFFRDRESSIISAENLKGKIKNTYSDLPELNTSFEFYEPDKMLIQFYEEIKRIAFEKYGTPRQIIQFMLRELNKHLNLKISFDSYLENKKMIVPDFGIYQFVDEENRRRKDIYNTIIEHGK